jgi:hypothetical protein
MGGRFCSLPMSKQNRSPARRKVKKQDLTPLFARQRRVHRPRLAKTGPGAQLRMGLPKQAQQVKSGTP